MKQMDFKTNNNPFTSHINKNNSNESLNTFNKDNLLNEKDKFKNEIINDGNQVKKNSMRREFSFNDNDNLDSFSLNEKNLEKQRDYVTLNKNDNQCLDFCYNNFKH